MSPPFFCGKPVFRQAFLFLSGSAQSQARVLRQFGQSPRAAALPTDRKAFFLGPSEAN